VNNGPVATLQGESPFHLRVGRGDDLPPPLTDPTVQISRSGFLR
jgi:hypothetical protein